MKSIKDLILENNQSNKMTQSNRERREELIEWLKGKNYPNYIETLNKMLEDPKAKTLLDDGFGGDLGDIKFKYKAKLIKASNLVPTQNEIDINKSLKRGLTNQMNIDKDFDDEIVINNMPVVTFRGNYVIDGHHRWAEAVAFNPEGKLLCFDYDADISPIQMLKAVQGSIAAVIASSDSTRKIPSSKTNDINLFDNAWNEKKIANFIDTTMTEDVEQRFKYYLNVSSREEVVKYIVDNILSMKANNHPLHDAPSRGEMPQTDKGGTNTDVKSTSYPTSKGSALNKLKNGKFIKDTLK